MFDCRVFTIKNYCCIGLSAVVDNTTDVEMNETSTSLGVKQKSSEPSSNEFCSSPRKLDLLAQVCSEIWEKMYEYHRSD